MILNANNLLGGINACYLWKYQCFRLSDGRLTTTKTTGKKVWDVPADKNELTYNTPVLADLVDGKLELIIAVPNEMWGFEPDPDQCVRPSFCILIENSCRCC